MNSSTPPPPSPKPGERSTHLGHEDLTSHTATDGPPSQRHQANYRPGVVSHSHSAPPETGADAHVIRTDGNAADGLSKCARCGATDIALNSKTGLLRCSFCRFEWSQANAVDAFGLDDGISDLSGMVMASGASDIIPSTEEVLTYKCSACGAEVVIDTGDSTQARCHWCRNKLSLNQQIPNGAVPDMVLPFRMSKDEAITRIRDFVKKRKFFANANFRREFAPENVVGVYLPYMVVDINAHATFTGEGEHQTRSYTVGKGDKKRRVYDADVYRVVRDFDVYINDLAVESSKDRLNQSSAYNSNNVINAIRPFDLENVVTYDANYLAGFSSERRDTNIDDLKPRVKAQTQDIARLKANTTLRFYDRGVKWRSERLAISGQRWAAAYLPVWLYSYRQHKSNGKTFLHYVAVNARTGKTMGSVPVSQPRLLLATAAVQLVGTILALIVMVVG